MTKNRLMLNCSKSNYILSKNISKTAHFKLQIKQNIIPPTNSVKYLGVILDNTLLWQTHIGKIRNKLSRVCGMVFKLIYALCPVTEDSNPNLKNRALPSNYS